MHEKQRSAACATASQPGPQSAGEDRKRSSGRPSHLIIGAVVGAAPTPSPDGSESCRLAKTVP